MARYEWITLDLLDPNNKEEFHELNSLFFEEEDFLPFIDYNMNSPFVFLIHQHIEIKEHYYKKTRKAIGFVFLHSFTNPILDSSLELFIGINKSNRHRGFMNWALEILNYKMLGFTTEENLEKKEYELGLKDYQIFCSLASNSYLNASFLRNGKLINVSNDQKRYQLELPEEKKKELKR